MVYIPNGVKEGCRVVGWVPKICYCCVTHNMEFKEEEVDLDLVSSHKILVLRQNIC